MASDKINEFDRKTLSLIQQGHIIMAELIDITGLTGETVNRSVEVLDQNRYIERKGFLGGDFWTFSITRKGMAVLPDIDALQQKFCEMGLWPSDLKTLRFFQDAGTVIASEYIYSKIQERDGQRNIAASMIKLLRLEYMREFGFSRRRVEIIEKGIELLTKYEDQLVN
jgi:DNA-binding MarR family transcriptional regulator